MKILLLISVFLCTNLLLYSQDIEPTQQQFLLNGQNTFLSGDSSYFKQNKFILGWAWGFGKTMSKNMLCNQAHVGPDSRTAYHRYMLKDSVNLVINTTNVWGKVDWDVYLASQSMCYSPVLKIRYPGTMGDIRPNDSLHYIFGFQYIKSIYF